MQVIFRKLGILFVLLNAREGSTALENSACSGDPLSQLQPGRQDVLSAHTEMPPAWVTQGPAQTASAFLLEGPLLLTLNKKSGTSVKFLSTQIFVLFPGAQNTQDRHWHISCVVSASFDYQGIAKQA